MIDFEYSKSVLLESVRFKIAPKESVSVTGRVYMFDGAIANRSLVLLPIGIGWITMEIGEYALCVQLVIIGRIAHPSVKLEYLLALCSGAAATAHHIIALRDSPVISAVVPLLQLLDVEMNARNWGSCLGTLIIYPHQKSM